MDFGGASDELRGPRERREGGARGKMHGAREGRGIIGGGRDEAGTRGEGRTREGGREEEIEVQMTRKREAWGGREIRDRITTGDKEEDRARLGGRRGGGRGETHLYHLDQGVSMIENYSHFVGMHVIIGVICGFRSFVVEGTSKKVACGY
jgi:hypothetical protein